MHADLTLVKKEKHQINSDAFLSTDRLFVVYQTAIEYYHSFSIVSIKS